MFTTFEGDNHVLTQLVAKELLTAYADDIKGMSPVEWVRFAANFAGERVMKRTAAETIMQTILDTRQDNEEEGSLFNRGTQVKMFEDREEYMLATVARRLQGKSKEMSRVRRVQRGAGPRAARRDARTSTASSWRRSSRASTRARTTKAREILGMVCDLYALSVIEDDRAWFMEHRFLSTERAKAVTRGINERCRKLRPLRRDCWSTGSGSPSSCATPRCCTRRTCPRPSRADGPIAITGRSAKPELGGKSVV